MLPLVGDLGLSLACWDYDRTRALADGRVKPEGISLTYLPMKMPESFFRMLRFREFDVSEMSLSWYVRTVALNPRPFVAIPVFPSRSFRHGCIFVNTNSGIERAADLVGKRIGVPEYQMTAAVWIKGILADDYGVPVDSVTYHTGGLLEPGRRETPMSLPSSISVEPIDERRTLSEMIDSGEIDALYTADLPEPVARGAATVRRLFPDFEVEEQAYLARTSIFPIMHVIVIRRETYESNPWIAQSLVKAFVEAKKLAGEDLREIVALKTMLPWLPAHVEATERLFGTSDFWPYGLADNHRTIDAFLRYSFDQGLSPKRLAPEDLFVPSTLETSKI